MATDIYTVLLYAAGTTYSKYDIVQYPTIQGFFFYSTTDGNVGNTPSPSSTVWKGVKSHNGKDTPEFFFSINYPASIENEPSVQSIRFGDGYEQRVQRNINNTLINLNFVLEKRTNAEAKAIAHFLHARRGSRSFVFTPPTPYNIDKLFVCKRWGFTYQFLNNNGIKVEFGEVPA